MKLSWNRPTLRKERYRPLISRRSASHSYGAHNVLEILIIAIGQIKLNPELSDELLFQHDSALSEYGFDSVAEEIGTKRNFVLVKFCVEVKLPIYDGGHRLTVFGKCFVDRLKDQFATIVNFGLGRSSFTCKKLQYRRSVL
jgi:hypothetical protein